MVDESTKSIGGVGVVNWGFFHHMCGERRALAPHTVVEPGIFHRTRLEEPSVHQARSPPLRGRLDSGLAGGLPARCGGRGPVPLHHLVKEPSVRHTCGE